MGKKTFLLGLAVLLAGKLFAMDLTVIAGAGNFSFDTSSETSLNQNGEEFKGHFFPFGKLNIKDQLTDTFGYTATMERDPLLRNTLSCEMTIDAGFLKLSVGPLFGMFNSWDTLIRPGVSTSLGLEFPGIFFLNLRGGATFGSEYSLETSCISLGFWLPNLLSTINLSANKYNDGPLIQDELLRVSYRADIHAKNIPYTVSIEMGYQALTRGYSSSGEDIIRAVFLGFEADVNIKPNFTLILGSEIPVFIWGKDDLKKAKNHWFFQAFAGFKWSLEKRTDDFIPLENMGEE